MNDFDRIQCVREIWQLSYERGVPPERVLEEYESAAHERLRARDTMPAPPPLSFEDGPPNVPASSAPPSSLSARERSLTPSMGLRFFELEAGARRE